MSPRSQRHANRAAKAAATSSSTKDAAAEKGKPKADDKSSVRRDGWRETIESFVIALILAFLFKTFEAEAFVIPTGSMAPTLRGVHQEVVNEQDFGLAVGNSRSPLSENDTLANLSVTLPMYGRTLAVQTEPGEPGAGVTPYQYSGDRILVSKTAYLFNEPERWDVIVFKCPHEAERNYIKRLIGLPGEVVRLDRGDVTVAKQGESTFTYARKPDAALRELVQPVFDTNYVDSKLHELGYVRWAGSEGWATPDGGKTYQVSASPAETAWLRYQHIVPTYLDWLEIEAGERGEPTPRLITDFSPYNSGDTMPDLAPRVEDLGLHWVSDLIVEADVTVEQVQGPQSGLTLELVKGGHRFQARFDLGTGAVTLWHDDDQLAAAAAPTSVQGPGTYQLGLSNIDHELRLWIDGESVPLTQAATYEPWSEFRPVEADLQPAGLGAVGVEATIERLELGRDVYYIDAERHRHTDFLPHATFTSHSDSADDEESLSWIFQAHHLDVPYKLAEAWQAVTNWQPERYADPARAEYELRTIEQTLNDIRHQRMYRLQGWADFYATPEKWDVFLTHLTAHAADRNDYAMAADQFFVLGDNSGSSSDSRLWEQYTSDRPAYVVPRELLLGKAMLIYWPHAWEAPYPYHVAIPLPMFNTELRLPFYPDWDRFLKWIH